jgi:hypothetical protein
VKIKRRLKGGRYPIQSDLSAWRYLGLRRNILAYARRTRTLDQLGGLLNAMIRSAKKELFALHERKKY